MKIIIIIKYSTSQYTLGLTNTLLIQGNQTGLYFEVHVINVNFFPLNQAWITFGIIESNISQLHWVLSSIYSRGAKDKSVDQNCFIILLSRL